MNNTLYSLLAYGWILWILYQSIFPLIRNGGNVSARLNSDSLFLLSCFLLIAWLRYPTLVYPYELNPDESQMTLHARSYFFSTGWLPVIDIPRPLDVYPLTLPGLLGFTLGFASSRCVGLIMILASVWFYFNTLRRMLSAYYVRVTILPVVLFFAFARLHEFVHYTSELCPALLLSAFLYLTVKVILIAHADSRQQNRLLFFAGLFAGMIPFSKEQAAIILIALLSIVTLIILLQKTIPFRARLLSFCYLFSGSILVPLVFIFVLFRYDQLMNSWLYYLKPMMERGNNNMESFFHTVLFFPRYLLLFSDNNLYFLPTAAVAVIFLITAIAQGGVKFIFHTTRGHLLLVSATFLLSSCVAVMKTGNIFGHYQLLLIFPFSFFLAASLAVSDVSGASPNHQRHRMALFCCTGLILLQFFSLDFNNYMKQKKVLDFFIPRVKTFPSLYVRDTGYQFGYPVTFEMSAVIRQYIRPNEPVTIYDKVMNTSIYEYSRAILGNTFCDLNYYQTSPDALNFLESKCIREITASKPVIIAYTDYFLFNRLTDFIRRNDYQFVRNVENYRVFVRSERLQH